MTQTLLKDSGRWYSEAHHQDQPFFNATGATGRRLLNYVDNNAILKRAQGTTVGPKPGPALYAELKEKCDKAFPKGPLGLVRLKPIQHALCLKNAAQHAHAADAAWLANKVMFKPYADQISTAQYNAFYTELTRLFGEAKDSSGLNWNEANVRGFLKGLNLEMTPEILTIFKPYITTWLVSSPLPHWQVSQGQFLVNNSR